MRLLQVLGPGCPKCAKLAENAQTAAGQFDEDVQVEKITDIGRITAFGVMTTPALAVDGEVRVVGRVPSADEIKRLLSS